MSIRRPQNDAYPRERAMPGIVARLASEDWSVMTSAANASANHVKSLDRWRRIARERNPNLDDEQTDRLASLLKTGHYRRMGRLSGRARRVQA